ncbi:MAG: DUF4340 domain-containing protein [Spirochaetaceae bacterium]|nr:DUF4340 domain-containing protein [Spirochaetaceae bacterium]
MEYGKKIKLLSGVIILLLAIYIIGTVFSAGNINRRRAAQLIFDRPTINRISAIRVDLDAGAGALLMQKENGRWFYTHNGIKYPAAEARIENFIDTISRLAKNQIVGTNPRSWERFDLAEGESRDAFFYDSSNNKLFSLHVGRRGPEGRGEYIRTSLSDEVYLIDSPILRFFIADMDFWSNLRVLPENIDNTTITAVRIRTDNEFEERLAMLNFSMREGDANNNFDWQDASGRTINRNTSNMLLNNIASLVGESFSEDFIIDRNGEIEIETVYGRFIIDIKLLEERNVLFGIRGGGFRYNASFFRIGRILNPVREIIEELN